MSATTIVKEGAVAATGGVAVTAAAQTAAGWAVPWVMSATGTVVKGVGTIHVVGGPAAILQTVSMVATPVGWAAAGGLVVWGTYHGVKYVMNKAPPTKADTELPPK